MYIVSTPVCVVTDYILQFRISKLTYWLHNSFPEEIKLQLTLSGVDYPTIIQDYLRSQQPTKEETKPIYLPASKPVTGLRFQVFVLQRLPLMGIDIERLATEATRELWKETLDAHHAQYELTQMLELNQSCPEYFVFNTNVKLLRELTQRDFDDEYFYRVLEMLSFVAKASNHFRHEMTTRILEIAQYIDEIHNQQLYLQIQLRDVYHNPDAFRRALACDMLSKIEEEGVASHYFLHLPEEAKLDYFVHHHFLNLCICLVRRNRVEGRVMKNHIHPYRYKVIQESRWLVKWLFDSSALLGATVIGNAETMRTVLTRKKQVFKSEMEVRRQLEALISIF